LIPRYTRSEMGRVWSDANKYAKWLEVELAATETLAEAGVVPKDVAATLRARAKADATRINDIESRVKHDVIAFTMAVGESVGDPLAEGTSGHFNGRSDTLFGVAGTLGVGLAELF